VNIFYEIGQTLPMTTLTLVMISNFFSKYWLVIFAGLTLSLFILKNILKQPGNRLRWDRFKLNIPLFGDLLVKIEICRISRTLSVLLKNGVPLDTALNVLKFTTINRQFQDEIGRILVKIKDGSSLNQAMKGAKIFNPSFINVVTIGEDSGTLEKVLEEVSFDYNKQVNRGIKNLLNVLEPLLILGVGLVVGFVVISMLLPIFQIDFNF